MKKFFPWATFLIVVATISAYFIVNQGELYPLLASQILVFTVSGNNLLGALTYFFGHVGLKHLLSNMIVFAVMGSILEYRLGRIHLTGLYLFSGVFAGLFYAFTSPGLLVIGASAAISGVILAGYIVDIKTASIALLGTLFLLSVIFLPLLSFGVDVAEQSTLQELQALEAEIAMLERADKDVSALLQERDLLSLRLMAVSNGKDSEDSSVVSLQLHGFGMLGALVYLVLFKRKAYSLFVKDVGKIGASI